MSNSAKLEHSSVELTNVHSPDKCEGTPCTIHNRSNHIMRKFPQHWRSDRGLMERICPHGIGHPDPDEFYPPDSNMWVHGCDGCCQVAGGFVFDPANSGKAKPLPFADAGTVQGSTVTSIGDIVTRSQQHGTYHDNTGTDEEYIEHLLLKLEYIEHLLLKLNDANDEIEHLRTELTTTQTMWMLEQAKKNQWRAVASYFMDKDKWLDYPAIKDNPRVFTWLTEAIEDYNNARRND